jgi:hypothetical protein
MNNSNTTDTDNTTKDSFANPALAYVVISLFLVLMIAIFKFLISVRVTRSTDNAHDSRDPNRVNLEADANEQLPVYKVKGLD